MTTTATTEPETGTPWFICTDGRVHYCGTSGGPLCGIRAKALEPTTRSKLTGSLDNCTARDICAACKKANVDRWARTGA